MNELALIAVDSQKPRFGVPIAEITSKTYDLMDSQTPRTVAHQCERKESWSGYSAANVRA